MLKELKTIGLSLVLAPFICLHPQITMAADLAVQQTNFSSNTLVSSTSELRLKLDRVPTADEGKLVVFIDSTDVTSQIQVIGTELVYQPTNFPLPPGATTLFLYLVKGNDEWREIAQFPLNVSAAQPIETKGPTVESSPTPSSIPLPTPSSNQPNPTEPTPQSTSTASPQSAPPQAPPPTFTITPRANVNLKSQLLEHRTADAGESKRPTFNDVTFEGGLSTQYTSGTLNIQTNFSLFGSSFQEEALRFSQLGEDAPNVDLSQYQVDVTSGSTQFTLGHLCYGNHPFLLNSLCSRGMVLKTKLGDRLDVSISSLSATSIVGFDNIFGIEDSDNRVTAATVGLQLIKNNAGGVRLETTLMQGSRKPVSSFNVGEVVDAEESRGFGVRLLANDGSGRLRADAGFVRSRFTNPNDPQLSEGIDIIEVKPVTRNAYYLEASYDLLKDVKLASNRTLSLTLNARHERVDPLFGTLGTFVTADQLRTQIGLNANIAGATLQFQQTRSEDNLANIPTVLKTKTRDTTLSLNVPLQSVLDVQSPFLPTLSYSFQKTRQFGANVPIPELSQFDPTEIPDQLNTIHQFGISWFFQEFSLSYQYSSAFQDNRQPSRENADFRNITNQIAIGWQPTQYFRLSLGYSWASAQSVEEGITRFNNGPTIGVSWEFIPNLTVAVNYNRTNNTDSLNQAIASSQNLEAILTWQFKLRGVAGQDIPASLFLRYGRQSNLNRDNLFDLSTNSTIQTVNAGFSFSF